MKDFIKLGDSIWAKEIIKYITIEKKDIKDDCIYCKINLHFREEYTVFTIRDVPIREIEYLYKRENENE